MNNFIIDIVQLVEIEVNKQFHEDLQQAYYVDNIVNIMD
jgi:hypothetical protein